MDGLKLPGRLVDYFKKYKFVALILLIGIVLMLLPGKRDPDSLSQRPTEAAVPEESISQQLAAVLGKIAGAGRVEVLLTEASGQETVYQANEDLTIGENTQNKRSDTVTVTDDKHRQMGLIRQVNPPKYLGALVVCQGADSPTVRLAIIEAVSKVTGLGADRISVLKMK